MNIQLYLTRSAKMFIIRLNMYTYVQGNRIEVELAGNVVTRIIRRVKDE